MNIETPSTTFKIRKSFNMVPNTSTISKNKPCAFYGKNGFCNKEHDCTHQDCKNFIRYQYCFQNLVNKCPYYHRIMCENWKKKGKCPIPDCTSLHKNCENYQNYKICKRPDCPFYHFGKENAIKNSPSIFIRKNASLRQTKKAATIVFKNPQNQISNNLHSNQNIPQVPHSTNELLQEQKEQHISNINQENVPPKRLITSFNAISNTIMPNPINSDHTIHMVNHNDGNHMHNLNRIENENLTHLEEEKSDSISSEEEEKTNVFSENSLPQTNNLQNIDLTQNNPVRLPQTIRRFHLNNLGISRPRNENQNIQTAENQESHGNLTIIRLNRTNNNSESNFSEGTIGYTLDRISQFATNLRNIRQALQNQEGDINSLNARFRSLRLIQERLNFVQRQERMVDNLDSLFETFLLINAFSNTNNMQGLRLSEFEKLPIFLYGIDDHLKNDNDIDYEESSTRKLCSICLEDYKINDLVKRLYCGHQFHEDCLREWTRKKIICPICKANIKDGINSNS